MGRLTLVVGGARSGKSAFALRLAQDSNRVAYIATATRSDSEMSQRIARHIASRPATWLTVEAPLDIDKAILALGETVDVIIVDCLTLFLYNILTNLNFEPVTPRLDEYETHILERMNRLLQAIKNVRFQVILVSNELGQGLVPPDPYSRFFRDMMGLVNQQAAQAADEVYKVEMGIPVRIK